MSNLQELKQKIKLIEGTLQNQAFVILDTYKRNDRELKLGLTQRLHQKCQRGRVWNSPAFLTALKNASYGFDEQLARSVGGRDGIFLLDRDFKPSNEMQRKIFDQYIDKVESGVEEIIIQLGASKKELQAVRLVSHHMRLLGVLWRDNSSDWLILVDYDNSD